MWVGRGKKKNKSFNHRRGGAERCPSRDNTKKEGGKIQDIASRKGLG